MNEQEEYAFKAAYQFYAKWREIVIEAEEQWNEYAEDVGELGNEIGKTIIGWRLFLAVTEAFGELYRNGMKPMPANYFGRDDI